MTIHKALQRMGAAIVVAVAVLLLVASAALAQEEARPWWHLTTVAEPAYIQPGQARDEVQRVTVAASTGTEYGLRDKGVGRVRGEVGSPVEVFVVAGEAPAQVQGALEEMYGTGNVEVTSPCMGAPSSACPETHGSYEVYQVKFVGKLADRFVYPITAGQEEYPFVAIAVVTVGLSCGGIGPAVRRQAVWRSGSQCGYLRS